jgi:hypothetical protein
MKSNMAAFLFLLLFEFVAVISRKDALKLVGLSNKKKKNNSFARMQKEHTFVLPWCLHYSIAKPTQTTLEGKQTVVQGLILMFAW